MLSSSEKKYNLFNLKIKMIGWKGPFDAPQRLNISDRILKDLKRDNHIDCNGKLNSGYISGLHTYDCELNLREISDPTSFSLKIPIIPKYSDLFLIKKGDIFISESVFFPYALGDKIFESGESLGFLGKKIFDNLPLRNLDKVYEGISKDNNILRFNVLEKEALKHGIKLKSSKGNMDEILKRLEKVYLCSFYTQDISSILLPFS